MTRCNKQPAKLKDIIGSFTPFLVAVLAQYILNFLDVAILFIRNMRSDAPVSRSATIGKLLQMDYNQPMNQAYLVLAQHIVFLICFGIWYYRIFYRGNIVSTDETFEDNTKGRMKNIFSCVCSIRTPFLLLAGVAIQIMVDGILNLLSPLFPDTFAAYYDLVSKAVGVNRTVPMIIATFVIAPIGEELFFRGVIMGYAKRYMPPAFAILFQGVLFGLYHGNIVQGIYACILGCLLGFVAYKADTLLTSMILHFSINLSVLFIPSVWFEDTVRCSIITAGALVLTVLFIWLAMRKRKAKTAHSKAESTED